MTVRDKTTVEIKGVMTGPKFLASLIRSAKKQQENLRELVEIDLA